MSKLPDPSINLVRAAIAGLFGSLGSACESTPALEEPDPTRPSLPADASVDCQPTDRADAAPAREELPNADGKLKIPSNADDALALSITYVKHTFEEVLEMCESRGGYLESHAGFCGAQGRCSGFSYTDWENDPVLVEHVCAGGNACNGLSCLNSLDAAGDDELTGEQMFYNQELGVLGDCGHCHEHRPVAQFPQARLKMYFWPGSGRTAENWKEYPAAYQEAITAFGAQGVTRHGLAYSNMPAYRQAYSKAEIQRAVQYMRDAPADEIKVQEIKVYERVSE